VSTFSSNVPMCPVRPGDACTLCVPGATGPHDCPLVALVMADPELRDRLAEMRRDARRTATPPGGVPPV
jgi:hypothetical protein